MPSRGGGRIVAVRSASRPRARTCSPRIFAGVVAAALLAWAGHACFPAFAPMCIHPDSARRLDVLRHWSCASACPPATARAGPKQSAATGTTGEPRGTGPTRFSAPAGDARLSRRGVVDRPGRAPLLRFRSPSALAGRDAFVQRMPAVRTIPLRRFRHRPAHYRSPSSMASARAVLRSRRCELEPSDVADVSGSVSEPLVFDDRCSGVHAFVITCIDRPTTSAGAGSHLPVRGRVIRRGRFSHAAFRTRHIPGSATWPDG
jgi:hypothetical protein